MIEIGRRCVYRVPQEQRLCKFCDAIEDESHFLLHCNLFHTERLQLLNDLNLHDLDLNDSRIALNTLLNTYEQRHLEHIGRFIHKCFEKNRESGAYTDQS